MRRTVSGISILSAKFRRRIRYICTCSRRHRCERFTKCRTSQRDRIFPSQLDGRKMIAGMSISPWSVNDVDERTYERIPWRGEIARRAFLQRIDVDFTTVGLENTGSFREVVCFYEIDYCYRHVQYVPYVWSPYWSGREPTIECGSLGDGECTRLHELSRTNSVHVEEEDQRDRDKKRR